MLKSTLRLSLHGHFTCLSCKSFYFQKPLYPWHRLRISDYDCNITGASFSSKEGLSPVHLPNCLGDLSPWSCLAGYHIPKNLCCLRYLQVWIIARACSNYFYNCTHFRVLRLKLAKFISIGPGLLCRLDGIRRMSRKRPDARILFCEVRLESVPSVCA